MNKQKMLCVAVGVCFLLAFFWVLPCQSVRADGIFVTEEEASFGGDAEGESTPEESRPQPEPQPQSQPEPQPQSQPESQPQPKPEQQPHAPQSQSKVESNPEPVQEKINQQEIPAVSQNSILPVFRVPVRRADSKSAKNIAKEPAWEDFPTKEMENKQEASSQETEPYKEEATGQGNSRWFLVAAGIFLVCGCMRILQRLKNRKE